MDSDIFQKQYDFEMTRKSNLSASVNVPIVALTILGGAISSMVLKFKYSDTLLTYFFVLLVLISICFSIYALVLVFKSQIGYFHHKIPSSSTLSNHHKKLIEWYVSQGNEQVLAKSLADIDFNDYLNRKLSEASDANGENNLKRGAYLHDANVKIAVALLFLVISSPSYIYVNLINTETPYKVQIVKPVHLQKEEIIMSPENDDSSNSESNTSTSTTTTTTSQSPPAEKPAEPPNVVFRDNAQDIEKKVNSSPNKGS